MTEEQKNERTKSIANDVVSNIEKSMEQDGKDIKDTLESEPQAFAQVEQNQAAIDQLHEEVAEVNQKLSNNSEEDIAREQIQKIKDNLKYLEDNLITQAQEEAAKLSVNGSNVQPDIAKTVELIKKFQGEVPGIEELAKKLSIRHEVDPELQKMIQQLKEAQYVEKLNKVVVDSKLKVLDEAIKVANLRSKLLKCQNKTDHDKIQKEVEEAKL